MVQLTNQLLAYSRGGKYATKTINICRLIETALRLSAAQIPHRVNIHTDLPDSIWLVTVDTDQMQMVFAAVLTNAWEAIAGGGCVHITIRNEVIKKTVAAGRKDIEPGNYVVIMIKDDGQGMGLETVERIFEPFFTTKWFGRGLGMSAAYGIVTNHQGHMIVDSEVDRDGAIPVPALPPNFMARCSLY